jgi:CheY-like chemotaxis protein
LRAVVVLVAEDEEPIAEIVTTILRDMDALPLVASHGQEALALARQHAPVLVITDLMMPLMNGAELIAALRAEAQAEGAPPPPVILMTAGGIERASGVGADVVLPKPFDLEALEAQVRRYLPTIVH